MSKPPAIDVSNLTVRYGSNVALNDVSITVPGGTIGLLGPNGAGKTTLLKTLLGFLAPDAGNVRLLGFELPKEALSARQRLGYMPETDIVSPKISAVSFLSYCGTLCGLPQKDAMQRAHEVLNYVGLDDNRYRKMETYSMGMRQRAKFGQALVHDPQILLLDEPTNGLDPVGRKEMLDLIKEISSRRGVAVVLSSHLLPDVEYVCDHVIVMHKGDVVRQGSIEELTALHEGLFEIRIKGDRDRYITALETLGCRCRNSHDGSIMVVKPKNVDKRDLFREATKNDAQVRHIVPVRARLEEVFIEAIRENSHAHI